MTKIRNKKAIAFATVMAISISLIAGFPFGKSADIFPTMTVSATESIGYVALGDSIATGYGLSGYTVGTTPVDSYANLLKENISEFNFNRDVTMANFAVDGITSGQMLAGLANSDSILNAQLLNSDVITLSIGSNDILQPFVTIIAAHFGLSPTSPTFSNDLALKISEMPPNELATSFSQLNNFLTNNPLLNHACANFNTNFSQIISNLKTKAPNAKIYVTNAYNPFYEVGSFGTLDLTSISEVYIQQINQAFLSSSNDYTLVDVYSSFKDSKDGGTSLVNTSAVNIDPHPNAQGHETISELISEEYVNGLLTIEISSAAQLAEFSQRVNNGDSYKDKIIKLTADIILNEDSDEYEDWGINSPNNSWTAIGTEVSPFAGTFDGNNHTVSGIYIDNDEIDQGLFGYSYGTIKNVGVVKSYIRSGNYCGGIVGSNDGGIIENCYNTGNVNGYEDIGGIVGWGSDDTIKNCYNTGNINGTNNVGGLIGIDYDGSIVDSYNTGIISGEVCTGGISGVVESVQINNCYNTGLIKGDIYVGGISGENVSYFEDGDFSITNSYNTGDVHGNSMVGGIVGLNGVNIENCYNTGNIIGEQIINDDYFDESSNNPDSSNEMIISGYIGGIAGLSYGNITACYNTGDVSGDSGIGGIIGCYDNFNSGIITNCYNTGVVIGTDKYVGGVIGEMYDEGNSSKATSASSESLIGEIHDDELSGNNFEIYSTKSYRASLNNLIDTTISSTYYYGCDVGIGGENESQEGTTKFSASLANNSIGINTTTTMTYTNPTWEAFSSLGNDFSIGFKSSLATIVGTTVTGTTIGTGTISMEIKQNGLTETGFNGTTKQIVIPISIPLTVTGAGVTPPSYPQVTTAPAVTTVPSVTTTPAPVNTTAPVVTTPEIIKIVETPEGFENADLISFVPNGNAFDDEIEVRIKDDPEVKQAIADKLKEVFSDDIASNMTVFPLDISLYIKGTDTKVQPKDGTSILITIPIPSDLLADKDNLKVVCLIDGELVVLETKIVLIDGVYCVQFTATHFSPYAIVVDKDNLLMTTIDDNSNPKTGNAIPYFLILITLTSGYAIFRRKKA